MAKVTLGGNPINTSGNLDAELSGASELRYSGNPTLGSIEMSGGSTIKSR